MSLPVASLHPRRSLATSPFDRHSPRFALRGLNGIEPPAWSVYKGAEMRCAMTGQPLSDPSDGVWDDGEWISWSYINDYLEDQALRAEFPQASLEVARAFLDLVDVASRYSELTGRYLEIWGELGELFVEVKYGLKRHRTHAPGSDGRIGNDFVEVKTLSPGKAGDVVLVKRAGNFNKVFLVRISKGFQFEARKIDRRMVKKGTGKYARVRWGACDKIEIA